MPPKPTGRPVGRPAGTPNKKRVQALALSKEVTQVLQDHLGADCGLPFFEGDAHAFLMSVYKNPGHPLDTRLDAAKAAIPYEKPKLQAMEWRGADGKPVNPPSLSIHFE
jgi:hypothetical protein